MANASGKLISTTILLLILLGITVFAQNQIPPEFPPYDENYPGSFEDYQRDYQRYLEAKQQNNQLTGSLESANQEVSNVQATDGSNQPIVNTEKEAEPDSTVGTDGTTSGAAVDDSGNGERTESNSLSTNDQIPRQPSRSQLPNSQQAEDLRIETTQQRRIEQNKTSAQVRNQEVEPVLPNSLDAPNQQQHFTQQKKQVLRQVIIEKSFDQAQQRLMRELMQNQNVSQTAEKNYSVTEQYIIPDLIAKDTPEDIRRQQARTFLERVSIAPNIPFVEPRVRPKVQPISEGPTQEQPLLDDSVAAVSRKKLNEIEPEILTRAIQRAAEKLVVQKRIAVLQAQNEKSTDVSQTTDPSTEPTAGIEDTISLITLIVEPTETMYDVDIYEDIPKSVASSADELVLSDDNVEVVDPDPLLVWHFAEISEPIEITYGVRGSVDEQQLQDTLTTPLSLKDIEQEENAQQQAQEQTEEPLVVDSDSPLEQQNTQEQTSDEERIAVRTQAEQKYPVEFIVAASAITFLLVSMFVLRKKEVTLDFEPPMALIHYIENQLSRGASKQAIIKRLVQEGWKKEQIQSVFDHREQLHKENSPHFE